MTTYHAKPFGKTVDSEASKRSWPDCLSADGVSKATGSSEKRQTLHLSKTDRFWLETWYPQKPDMPFRNGVIKAPPPPHGVAKFLNFTQACEWLRLNGNEEGLEEIKKLPMHAYGTPLY
jgi:hypothetical protein